MLLSLRASIFPWYLSNLNITNVVTFCGTQWRECGDNIHVADLIVETNMI